MKLRKRYYIRRDGKLWALVVYRPDIEDRPPYGRRPIGLYRTIPQAMKRVRHLLRVDKSWTLRQIESGRAAG